MSEAPSLSFLKRASSVSAPVIFGCAVISHCPPRPQYLRTQGARGGTRRHDETDHGPPRRPGHATRLCAVRANSAVFPKAAAAAAATTAPTRRAVQCWGHAPTHPREHRPPPPCLAPLQATALCCICAGTPPGPTQEGARARVVQGRCWPVPILQEAEVLGVPAQPQQRGPAHVVSAWSARALPARVRGPPARALRTASNRAAPATRRAGHRTRSVGYDGHWVPAAQTARLPLPASRREDPPLRACAGARLAGADRAPERTAHRTRAAQPVGSTRCVHHGELGAQGTPISKGTNARDVLAGLGDLEAAPVIKGGVAARAVCEGVGLGVECVQALCQPERLAKAFHTAPVPWARPRTAAYDHAAPAKRAQSTSDTRRQTGGPMWMSTCTRADRQARAWSGAQVALKPRVRVRACTGPPRKLPSQPPRVRAASAQPAPRGHGHGHGQ